MPDSKRVCRVLSGAEFNEKYQDIQFVKLTNSMEYHNGFQFCDGLNEDSVPFNPHGYCRAGGIYFVNIDNAYEWTFYNAYVGRMKYMRMVIIPSDAQVWVEDCKFKANKIILGPRKLISKEIYEKILSTYNITAEDISRELGYDITKDTETNTEINTEVM